MRCNPTRTTLLSAGLASLLVIAACAEREADMTEDAAAAEMPAMMHDADGLTPEISAELDQMWAATAQFASFDDAQTAGWNTKLTECMTSENGGQGYHYGNPALIDDNAQIDPLRPELVLYEPKADGSMELVAVEWVIPVGAWTETTPPRVFGQDMHVNETYGLWVLHVWKRSNPSGLFSDWNPTVSCPSTM